ncbi:MAG: hypothetical protein J6K45_00545 [Clostridia bacterium]|nr:hypothetical protein [Clostridia bacterium]
MINYSELADKLLKYMSDYDWYNLVDECGNIEIDSNAKTRAKETIIYNLTNEPNSILKFLNESIEEMDTDNELYNQTKELIKEIKELCNSDL